MLTTLVQRLGEIAETTSVVARDPQKLWDLSCKSLRLGENYEPISCDYRNREDLFLSIHRAISMHGPVDLVISWIHGAAHEASSVVASAIASDGSTVPFIDVRGSAASRPEGEPNRRRQALEMFSHVDYRRVVLGFQHHAAGTRWLTHDEICEGLWDAVALGRKDHIVGQVCPWESRPQ